MASNRFRAGERGAALAATVETPSQALNALARRAAHIQIAFCSAAATTLTGRAATTLPRVAVDHFDACIARASTNN